MLIISCDYHPSSPDPDRRSVSNFVLDTADDFIDGVDRIQRNFEPMRRQVESWRQAQITDEHAKLILYSAFVEGKLEAPKGLLPNVHQLYFEPEYPEFAARTMWSLSNAFTSAFKKLDPIPQFQGNGQARRIPQLIARWLGRSVRFSSRP